MHIPGRGAQSGPPPVDKTWVGKTWAGRPWAGKAWGLVVRLSVAQLVSWGCLYYSFSLFIIPMEADLGWNRTTLNGALSIGLATMGLAAYPVGAWIDQRGGRLVMSLGSALGGAMLLWWSVVETVWAFYGIWVGLGAAMAATLYDPAFAVLTRQYPDSYRSRITVLTLLGGFASTVFIPVTQILIDAYGWRMAAFALGLVVLALPLPIHLLLRDGFHGVGKAHGADGATGPTLSEMKTASQSAFRDAVRQPPFWGLAICFTLYYLAFTAMTFHLIPLLSERQTPMALVIGAIAVIGPAQVAGRIAILAVGRRMTAVGMGVFALSLMPASMLVLMIIPLAPTAIAIPLLFAFALIYGMGNGIMTIVRGTIVPDLMGRSGYGRINGALSIPASAAKAAAPSIAAALWLFTGGYDVFLWAALAALIVAAAGFGVAVATAGAIRPTPPS